MRDALGRVQRVLVLGGRSEIAGATLRALLRDGPLEVVLAARSPGELETGELEAQGATVDRAVFDARAVETHADALAPIFAAGDVDLVLVAFGVLGRQEQLERDAAAAVELVETNYVGAVSALTLVAEQLRAQGHGTIVVLSSVAAERARRSNYVYGSSKAGLDAFAQGLQLMLDGTGVNVLIVRPGFVHTRMTRGLRPAPLAVEPAEVGGAIARALRDGKSVVRVPRSLDAVMWLVRRLPRRALVRL